MKKSKASHSRNLNKRILELSSFHAAMIALESGHAKRLRYSSGVPAELLARARQKEIPLIKVEEILHKSSERSSHFVLEADTPLETPIDAVYTQLRDEIQNCRIVLLNHVFDPHNLGAIFRSAAEFSIDLLLIPRRRAAPITETVCAVSSGAVFLQAHCCIQGSMQVMKQLADRGCTIVGTSIHGYPLHNYSFAKRTVLVLGSEGSGISEPMKKKCHHLVTIPTSHRVDSLNVAVAAGICMHAMDTHQVA